MSKKTTDGDEDLDILKLLKEAGRDPDESIAKFTLEDYASALVDSGNLSREEIVGVLKTVNVNSLANAFLEASGWTQIFEDYATG
jgi:hypothetical protein